MLKQLFRTKSVDKIIQDAEIPEHKLKRVLTATDITILGVGCIIGAGIFVLTGVAAANHAGPAIMISFIIAGLACAFSALCYAEFASLIPIAGSAYTYAYATLGEIIAWIIGWDLILEYSLGGCAVSIGWSSYLCNMLKDVFGVQIPVYLTAAPGTIEGVVTFINLPAALIVLIITTLLVIGIRESAKANNIVVFIQTVVILFFIAMGIFAVKVNPSNWIPFAPFGWKGIMTGAALVFFAYIGFDTISTTAEEAKNPQRDLPRGIIGSLVICTILYIAVAAVLTGIALYSKLGTAAPLATALSLAGKYWASGIISVGALFAITSTLLVLLLGQPRIFFAMSRDRLFPGRIAKVHPKFKTPYVPTIITGVTIAVLAAFTPIATAAELCNIGTLFAFVLVCAGIIVLRYTKPDLKRPFKCPLVPIIPGLGILFCVYLMLSLPALTWFRFGFWLVIGLFIYFVYGRFRSKLRDEE